MSRIDRHPDAPALMVGMNVRFSLEQRAYLEEIAGAHDLTLSGAVRHVVDESMDAPGWVVDDQGEPLLSWREAQQAQTGEGLVRGQLRQEGDELTRERLEPKTS